MFSFPIYIATYRTDSWVVVRHYIYFICWHPVQAPSMTYTHSHTYIDTTTQFPHPPLTLRTKALPGTSHLIYICRVGAVHSSNERKMANPSVAWISYLSGCVMHWMANLSAVRISCSSEHVNTDLDK